MSAEAERTAGGHLKARVAPGGGANPRRLQIAMVAACPFPSPRGTPLRIEKLAAALAARGHEVHVVTYHLGVGDVPAGVRVHRTWRVPFESSLPPGPTFSKLAIMDPLLAQRLRGVLTKHAIDVVHAHHYEGLAVALAAGRGAHRRVPIVYDAHTILESELPEYALPMPRAMARRIGAFIDRRLPRRATHVVAVTERLRARLVGEFRVEAARASVVSNGVEPAFFDACGRAIDARANHGASSSAAPPPPPPASSASPAPTDATAPPLAANAATLVFSGNLAAYQGLQLMLEAFFIVQRAQPATKLLVLVNPGLEFDVPPKVAGIVDVVPCEPRDLPAQLVAADIALSPRPRADGLPMKVLNYMAAGLPTVAFRDAAGPLEDGRTGVLVDEVSAAAYARAIIALLDDRARATRLGRVARETVAARYTWEAAAQSLEALYAQLLEARGDAAGADERAAAPSARRAPSAASAARASHGSRTASTERRSHDSHTASTSPREER